MKTILYALKDMFRHYAVWRGRLSRAGYWWAVLGIVMVDLALWCLYSAALSLYPEAVPAVYYGLAAWNGVCCLPLLCAGIRRYHDTGRPGWKALLAGVGSPLLLAAGVTLGAFLLLAMAFSGGFLGAGEAENRRLLGFVGAFLGMIGGGAALGVWNLSCLIKPSEPGENRYGEPVPFLHQKKDDEL